MKTYLPIFLLLASMLVACSLDRASAPQEKKVNNTPNCVVEIMQKLVVDSGIISLKTVEVSAIDGSKRIADPSSIYRLMNCLWSERCRVDTTVLLQTLGRPAERNFLPQTRNDSDFMGCSTIAYVYDIENDSTYQRLRLYFHSESGDLYNVMTDPASLNGQLWGE